MIDEKKKRARLRKPPFKSLEDLIRRKKRIV